MNKNQSSSPRTLTYLSLILSVTALTLALVFFLRKENIVYVDSMKLFANYKGSLKAKTEYEKKLTQWKANVDTLTAELNNSITKYEREKAGMTVKEKKLTEELIVNKRKQFENYKAAISENAAKEDQSVTGQVTKEINDFLMRYGETHGYDYILGATNTGNVVFARKGKNITDEVLKELNAEFQSSKK
jgi:outer membrane protein